MTPPFLILIGEEHDFPSVMSLLCWFDWLVRSWKDLKLIVVTVILQCIICLHDSPERVCGLQVFYMFAFHHYSIQHSVMSQGVGGGLWWNFSPDDAVNLSSGLWTSLNAPATFPGIVLGFACNLFLSSVLKFLLFFTCSVLPAAVHFYQSSWIIVLVPLPWKLKLFFLHGDLIDQGMGKSSVVAVGPLLQLQAFVCSSLSLWVWECGWSSSA